MFEVMDPTPLDEEAACRICDRPLTGDPDDQPDPPLGPMCGDCHRARQRDVNASEMDRTGPG
jgi:hypothetical protein